jgi:tetratricopeptide (TPR) repeat protein
MTMKEYVLLVILVFVPIGALMAYLLRREGISARNTIIILMASCLIIMFFPVIFQKWGKPGVSVILLAVVFATVKFCYEGKPKIQPEEEQPPAGFKELVMLQESREEPEVVAATRECELEEDDNKTQLEELKLYRSTPPEPVAVQAHDGTQLADLPEPEGFEFTEKGLEAGSVLSYSPDESEEMDIIKDYQPYPPEEAQAEETGTMDTLDDYQSSLAEEAQFHETETVDNLEEPIQIIEHPDTQLNTGAPSPVANESPALPGEEEHVLQILEEGFASKFQGDMEKAASCFSEVYNITSDEQVKYLLAGELANIYKQSGLYDKAVALLEGYLETKTDIPGAVEAISKELSYLNRLTGELGRLGIEGLPFTSVPRWVKLKAAEQIEDL